MKYICPVCGYDQLSEAPDDYNICPCCWTEFGVSDIEHSFRELQAEWIQSGFRWHSRVVTQPANWDPIKQLERVRIPVPVSESATTIVVSLPATTRVIPIGRPSGGLWAIRPVRVESRGTASIGFAVAQAHG